MMRFPTTILNLSWPTRTTRISRRNRCAQNWCRIGVNCPQPAIVARPGHHHTPAGRNLDPREGFLVWFAQKSGAPHGAAGMLHGGLEKQSPIGWVPCSEMHWPGYGNRSAKSRRVIAAFFACRPGDNGNRLSRCPELATRKDNAGDRGDPIAGVLSRINMHRAGAPGPPASARCPASDSDHFP